MFVFSLQYYIHYVIGFITDGFICAHMLLIDFIVNLLYIFNSSLTSLLLDFQWNENTKMLRVIGISFCFVAGIFVLLLLLWSILVFRCGVSCIIIRRIVADQNI